MHATEAEIVLLLEKKLPPEDRQRVRAHLADCPQCAEMLAAVYHMPAVLARHPDVPPVPAPLRRRAERLVQRSASTPLRARLPARPTLAVLASVAVISLVLLAYFQRDMPDLDRFRAPDAGHTLATIAPAHGLTVDAESLEFHWASLPTAAAYRLLLYNQDGTAHWIGRSTTTLLALPDTVALTPGARYLWRVEAIFSNGTATSSELRTFTVAMASGE